MEHMLPQAELESTEQTASSYLHHTRSVSLAGPVVDDHDVDDVRGVGALHRAPQRARRVPQAQGQELLRRGVHQQHAVEVGQPRLRRPQQDAGLRRKGRMKGAKEESLATE